jgi:hypothetical protein
VDPDYTAGLAILSVTNQVTYVDDLLLIWGIGTESIGANFASGRSDSGKAFLAEFGRQQEELFRYVPVQIPTLYNTIADSILRMRAVTGDERMTVRWPEYFCRLNSEISHFEAVGTDTRGMRDEIGTALAQQPAAVRREISLLTTNGSSPKRIFNRFGRRMLRGCGLEDVVDKHVLHRKPPKQIRGADNGFANIFECSQYLNTFTPAHSKF